MGSDFMMQWQQNWTDCKNEGLRDRRGIWGNMGGLSKVVKSTGTSSGNKKGSFMF